jgi:malate dehydrogenase
MATVPVDCLVYLMHQKFSIPRQKVIGLNRNDTCRFRWALARTLAVPSTAIEAYVVGEHGESQVPVFSQVRIKGQKVVLKAEQIQAVQAEISGFFAHWMRLKPGRTAGWTSAESIGDIVAGMTADNGRIFTCSTPLAGEYGFSEVSLGVPVKLGRKGVQDIIELPLDAQEKGALAASAAIVQNQIREAQALLGGA